MIYRFSLWMQRKADQFHSWAWERHTATRLRRVEVDHIYTVRVENDRAWR